MDARWTIALVGLLVGGGTFLWTQINRIPGEMPLPDPRTIDPEQLKMGIEIEMEHSTRRGVARRIAMQHLAEIKDYYTRLRKMEAEAKGK